jgi:NDP-sugar pyrophosphorylase family protein
MTGFILAAGFGTRLRPLTEHLPKALVPICGEPLLARNLRYLHENGFDRIGVNAHHHPEQIAAFQAQWPGGFELFHETGAIRGTGGGIHFARDFLAVIARRFEAMDCIGALIAAEPPDPMAGSILYDPASGELRGVPATHQRADNERFADFIGMALYRREFLAYLTNQDFSVVPVWERARGESIRVIVASGSRWHDAGRPASVARIHFDLLDGAFPLSTSADMVIDREKKIACPRNIDSRVRSNLGPYTWTDTADIDPTARLRRCVVLAGSRVEAGTVATDCIISPWGAIPTHADS